MSARTSDDRSGPTRFFAALACVFVTTVACAAPGSVIDLEVELPTELQAIASRDGASLVAHARVRIALPAPADVADAPPILLVSATADAAAIRVARFSTAMSTWRRPTAGSHSRPMRRKASPAKATTCRCGSCST